MARKLTAQERRAARSASQAAVITVDLLIKAYNNGEDNQHMDWNDVDLAYNQALHTRALLKRAGLYQPTRRKL
jgi:hypothetical protein